MVDYIQCILDVWQARKYAIGQNSAKQKAANWLKNFLMCTESINTFYGLPWEGAEYSTTIWEQFRTIWEKKVTKTGTKYWFLETFKSIQCNLQLDHQKLLTLHIILLGSCSIVSDIWVNSLLCSWLKNDKIYIKHWQ